MLRPAFLFWSDYIIPAIVTISSPLQFLFSPVVLVLVVDQLFVSAKFSPEVVYRFIINNTEFYYFKRSSVIHKVFLASPTSILAHLSLGNPKIPELIAGIEIDLNFLSEASVKLLLSELLSLASSFPSPIFGPTA